MKQYYDRTHKVVEFSVGDLVTLYTPAMKEGISRKLQKVNSGPFTVEKKNSEVTFTISPGVSGRKTQVVHVQRLSPFFSPLLWIREEAKKLLQTTLSRKTRVKIVIFHVEEALAVTPRGKFSRSIFHRRENGNFWSKVE
jgi:hypothetical protein